MIKKLVAVLLLTYTSFAFSQEAYGQNSGFEGGTTTGWTISNGGTTTASGGWSGNGSGVTTTTGMTNFCPGGGKCWTVKPYGTYMAAVQAGNSSPTFDTAMNTLGISASNVTAIKNTIYANGNMYPTNAASISKSMTLQAGTTYTFAWQYISTDYMPYNDGSMITLVKVGDPSVVGNLNGQQSQYALLGFTNTGTGNYSTNSYGATGWQVAQFTVPSDGNYLLGFASFNLGDTILSPILFIDEVQGETLLNGQTFAPVQPNAGSTAPPPPSPGPSLCCGGSDSSFGAKQANVNAVTAFTATQKSAVIIDQIGMSNLITVQQMGTRANYAKYTGNGNNNNVTINQSGNPSTTANYIDLGITGNGNTVSLTQTSTSGTKGIFASVSNNSNSVTVQQKDSGNHYLDLTLTGGNKTVSVTQQGSAAHMANINLSGLATGLTLTQSGSTQQFYSITHSCATAGGCGTISVTQGQ